MRYRVTHRTTYTYDKPVTDSYGLAYVTPRTLPSQEVEQCEVMVSPAPSDLTTREDYLGNLVTYFQVTEPHRRLEVEAVSTIRTAEPTHPEASLAQPWERARPLEHPDLPGSRDATDLALPSALVEQTEQAAAYGAASLTPGRPLGEAVIDLMRRVHRDFTYDKTATTVTSTIPDVFESRAGVCQDFAHLMLACLRSHGLAVRYVSGYLATDPPPGKPRIVGADASHAWVAVWLPGVDGAEDAWLAVDPTNDQTANERYVTVAWGRDYADVPPVKGVIFTEAKRSTLKVSVDVAPLDEDGNLIEVVGALPAAASAASSAAASSAAGTPVDPAASED
ncbi:transglutaminase family protein [Nocardioides sp. GY 10127]|uniref:transglutaminase family protein n=1 Tax=Nocardioides sp. GY 10127 TaxID=2569762 RepID=UPI0010A91A27|nr:transglutaminase family protein [Nocardioides sp. GY 10127]TIC82899.1 transglutaminase family protein [Nocardioides sp. GY 10127]